METNHEMITLQSNNYSNHLEVREMIMNCFTCKPKFQCVGSREEGQISKSYHDALSEILNILVKASFFWSLGYQMSDQLSSFP